MDGDIALRPAAMVDVSQVADLVADIWRETFAVENVGPGDNFFQLGGDSLVAVRMVAAVDEVFGFLIDGVDVFRHAEFSQFTALLEDRLRDRAVGTDNAAWP